MPKIRSFQIDVADLGGTLTLDSIGGIDIASIAPGEILFYGGSPAGWKNATLEEAGILSGVRNSETIIATALQTVFTLSAPYSVGINTLDVYINGAHQAPSAYTETNSTTVTFSEGLQAGDIVQFVGIVPITINTVAAGSVSTTGGGNVQQFIDDLIITGTAAPTINADFVGQQFIDTTNDDAYIAIQTGTGSTDWKKTTP